MVCIELSIDVEITTENTTESVENIDALTRNLESMIEDFICNNLEDVNEVLVDCDVYVDDEEEEEDEEDEEE